MGRVERDADATRTREGGGGGFPHPPAPKSRARVVRLLTRAGRRSHRRAWPRPPTPRPPSRGARYTRTTPGGGARSPSPRAAPPTRAAATAPCAATRVNARPACATVVSYLRPGRAGSRRAATGLNSLIQERGIRTVAKKLVTIAAFRFSRHPQPPFSRRPRELDASGGAPVRTRARRLCTIGLTNILLALFRSRRSLSPRRFGSADSGASRSSRSSFYALAAPSSAIILALLRSSASLLSAAYSLLACSSAVGPISCGAVAASLA